MAIPIIGNIIDKVIEKGGDIIGELVTDKDLAKQLDHEFRTQMEANRAEFQALEIQADRDKFVSQQEVIKAELHQNDVYTKRTRPIIARRSFYAGLGYALLTALPEDGIAFFGSVIMPWQFEWTVLMLLYSPALTYMGVRGVEKWKGMVK